jgi:hypothetical protein
MRPGRWETTVRLDFGARKLPEQAPFTKPFTHVSCVTPQEAKAFDAGSFVPPPDENCKATPYKVVGNEITFVMKCDDVSIDFRTTMHSPESFTGIATSHGKDPNEKLVMKFDSKRTGDKCSAKELAEDADD